MQHHAIKSFAENQTTRQTRDFGKSQEEDRICSGYIERERNGENDAVKRVERPKIADFFLAHHRPDEQLRLLSLPCIHWSFEQLIAERSPDRECRFFGLEWTWGVIELGRPYMPGGRTEFSTIFLDIGEIDRLVTAGHARSAKVVSHWLWVRAASFLTINRTDKANKRYREHFAKVYKRNSCVWLDFTSQLHAEMREAITHVGSYVNLHKESVPVAVTFMAARDDHSSDAGRVAEASTLLAASKWRSFALADWWKYTHHDVPMITVCGLMRLK